MIDAQTITGPLPAFIAGLVTSLHCVGMCGPLACSLIPKPGSDNSFAASTALYHLGRTLSYTFIGALAGGLGLVALGWIQIYENSLSRFFPWFLVLFFLLIALRADQFFPKPKVFGTSLFRIQRRIGRLPHPLTSLLTGLLTPLLPCAPLYAVFGLALLTQSPLLGAEFLLLFALGTLPLLWLVQAAFARWQNKLTPLTLSRIQRGLAAVAALVIAMRLYFYETGQDGLFCGFGS
jgi:sulfite exporter TauE/SafE